MLMGILRRRAVRRFSRQLAMLLEAGVRLDIALKLIRSNTRSRRWARKLDEVQQGIREGHTFAKSLGWFGPRDFESGYLEVIEWAEESGDPQNLILALRFLSDDFTPRSSPQSEPGSESQEDLDLFSRALRG